MEQEQLKPCPFCGSEVSVYNNEFDYENLFWIECEECEGMSVSTKSMDDLEEVIDTWNTRVGEVNGE